VASRVYFSLICRKQVNYVYDEKTEKQPKVLDFGLLLIGTIFAPGKAHFRAVRKNRPVSASTPQCHHCETSTCTPIVLCTGPSPPPIAFPPPNFTLAACRALFLPALNEALGSPCLQGDFFWAGQRIDSASPPLALYLNVEEKGRRGFDPFCLGSRRPLEM